MASRAPRLPTVANVEETLMAMAGKTWLVAIMAALASAPTLAAAHGGGHGPPPAPHHQQQFGRIAVSNHFDGKVEVWIDGRFKNILEGGCQQQYTLTAEFHDILVRRPDTHFVLLSRSYLIYPDQMIVGHVNAPTGTLRVDNQGEVALKLDIGDTAVWISPRSAVEVPVVTGNVEINASMKEPRGEWKAVERTVWVEPGRPGATTLRPDPTVIVITNHENYAVHALFDGDDAGWVAPGETRRVWVRPGPTQVLLLDRNGRVRTTAQLSVQRGSEAKVVVQPAFHVANAVVSNGPPRPNGPAGPVRPGGWYDEHPDHDHHEDCPHR